MSTLTHNRTGRPKGSRDKTKRKRKATTKEAFRKRSEAAKRAAATRARNRAEKAAALKKSAPDLAREKSRPDVEPAEISPTPYPRAGDNPEFRAFLEELKDQDVKKDTPQPAAAAPGELLQVKDVAEWVAWPFMAWATKNNLNSLMLTDAEATELAEPLTNILNRHGVAELVPPDVMDGLKLAARATPVMLQCFDRVKRERQRRAAAGDGAPDQPNVTGPHGGGPGVQGAPIRAPKEV